MKPTKILEEKSWDETMLSPTQLIGMERIEGLPTYSMAYNMMRGNTKNTEDLPAVARYFYGIPGALGGMLVDGIGQIGNTALNGYKRLYNAGADLTNRAKLELIDKQIKDFQKKNPNKNALPVGKKFEYKSAAEKAKEAGAATDAEVWAATHEFGYGNDPRTVYRRYRYRKAVNNTPRVSL